MSGKLTIKPAKSQDLLHHKHKYASKIIKPSGHIKPFTHRDHPFHCQILY